MSSPGQVIAAVLLDVDDTLIDTRFTYVHGIPVVVSLARFRRCC